MLAFFAARRRPRYRQVTWCRCLPHQAYSVLVVTATDGRVAYPHNCYGEINPFFEEIPGGADFRSKVIFGLTQITKIKEFLFKMSKRVPWKIGDCPVPGKLCQLCCITLVGRYRNNGTPRRLKGYQCRARQKGIPSLWHGFIFGFGALRTHDTVSEWLRR